MNAACDGCFVQKKMPWSSVSILLDWTLCRKDVVSLDVGCGSKVDVDNPCLDSNWVDSNWIQRRSESNPQPSWPSQSHRLGMWSTFNKINKSLFQNNAHDAIQEKWWKGSLERLCLGGLKAKCPSVFLHGMADLETLLFSYKCQTDLEIKGLISCLNRFFVPCFKSSVEAFFCCLCLFVPSGSLSQMEHYLPYHPLLTTDQPPHPRSHTGI